MSVKLSNILQQRKKMDAKNCLSILINIISNNILDDDDDDEINEYIMCAYHFKGFRTSHTIEGYSEILVPTYSLSGK